MSDTNDTLKLINQLGETMYDYDNDVEVITNAKCVECGDKLAPFENNLCLICEAIAE